jgi:hypothetical protein
MPRANDPSRPHEQSRPEPAGADGGRDPIVDPIVGRWRKRWQDPDAAPYPDELQFSPDGLYHGTRGAGGASFTVWDAGTYDVIGRSGVRLSTANDQNVTYSYAIDGDEMTFIDPQGKRVCYGRAEHGRREESAG